MKHSELVAAAVAWLRRGVPHGENGRPLKCSHVFGEFVSYATERPDAIGWHQSLSGLSSIVVECKTSRADFFRDRDKSHMRSEMSGMGRRRYYLLGADVPVAFEEAPVWCGVARVDGRGVVVLKEAPLREIDSLAAQEECTVLGSAIRRLMLGVPFDAKRGRFETVAAGEARKAGAA